MNSLILSLITLVPLVIISQSMWDTAMWTWISGSNSVNVAAVYGTKGVPSLNNHPGSRRGSAMVFHPSMNFLFLFGGQIAYRGGL